MSEEPRPWETLSQAVASGESLYAICDAGRNQEIPIRLRAWNIQHDCLYHQSIQ